MLKGEGPLNLLTDAPPAKAQKRGQFNLQDVGTQVSAPKSLRQAKFAVKAGRQTTLNENIETTSEKRKRIATTQKFEKGAAKPAKVEEAVEAIPTERGQLTLMDVGVKGSASSVTQRPKVMKHIQTQTSLKELGPAPKVAQRPEVLK